MNALEEIRAAHEQLTAAAGVIMSAAVNMQQNISTHEARIKELHDEIVELRGRESDLALDLDHGFTKKLGTGAQAKLVIDLNEVPAMASNRENDAVDDGITLGRNQDGTSRPGGEFDGLDLTTGDLTGATERKAAESGAQTGGKRPTPDVGAGSPGLEHQPQGGVLDHKDDDEGRAINSAPESGAQGFMAATKDDGAKEAMLADASATSGLPRVRADDPNDPR